MEAKGKTIIKMRNIEHNIQSAFFRWVSSYEKTDERLKLIFAVPNGGHRSIKTAVALKQEGVRAGVPDVLFTYSNGIHTGLAIEFKRPKMKPTEKQKEFMDTLQKYGWQCVVCTDALDAIQIVKEYLKIS